MGFYVSGILTCWLSFPSCSYCVLKTPTHISQDLYYLVIIMKQLKKWKQNFMHYLYENRCIAQQGTVFDIYNIKLSSLQLFQS